MAVEKNSRKFPVLARNRRYDGFGYEEEGRWNGPFWFLQAADTQLGMMDTYLNQKKTDPSWDREMELCERLVLSANRSQPKPRFVIVCGDLVDAMPRASKPAQIRDFKSVFAKLDSDIKPICVCGNHDVGDHPGVDDIDEYRREFGDDFFSFWVGGCKFLVFNSQYFVDDRGVKELRRQQDVWMDDELKPNPNMTWKHLIGFQHIPPFIAHKDEERVAVPGTDLPFNIPDLSERRAFLAKLKQAGVSKLFCGHYHRNAGAWDDRLEVIVTSAVGCQLGQDDHGYRVVKVFDDRITHNYYPLTSAPTHIDLTPNSS